MLVFFFLRKLFTIFKECRISLQQNSGSKLYYTVLFLLPSLLKRLLFLLTCSLYHLVSNAECTTVILLVFFLLFKLAFYNLLCLPNSVARSYYSFIAIKIGKSCVVTSFCEKYTNRLLNQCSSKLGTFRRGGLGILGSHSTD